MFNISLKQNLNENKPHGNKLLQCYVLKFLRTKTKLHDASSYIITGGITHIDFNTIYSEQLWKEQVWYVNKHKHERGDLIQN